MKSHVHYEAAFEDFLRSHHVPYLAVDEARRAVVLETRLKSFDFIACAPGRTGWLIDVKGRRWAARPGQARPAWENWITRDDLEGLRRWRDVFGAGWHALLVFAYWVDAPDASPPAEIVHGFGAHSYVFVGVALDDYARHARLRSPRWGTLRMPASAYRRHARPVAQWL